MNHNYDPSLIPPSLKELTDGFEDKVKKIKAQSFGETGRFPNGQLDEHDEGEIQFGVASDPERKLVHIDFGKPVQTLAMTPKQARGLGLLLSKKANDCRRGRS